MVEEAMAGGLDVPEKATLALSESAAVASTKWEVSRVRCVCESSVVDKLITSLYSLGDVYEFASNGLCEGEVKVVTKDKASAQVAVGDKIWCGY
jgi:hypothetical protein